MNGHYKIVCTLYTLAVDSSYDLTLLSVEYISNLQIGAGIQGSDKIACPSFRSSQFSPKVRAYDARRNIYLDKIPLQKIGIGSRCTSFVAFLI
jgi:hypothetical protein